MSFSCFRPVGSDSESRDAMQCRSPAAVKNVTLRDQRKHIILVMVEAGGPLIQWEFQDPKMQVLYHIRPYFAGDIPLHRPYIGLIYGRYLQFRFLKWPLINFFGCGVPNITPVNNHHAHQRRWHFLTVTNRPCTPTVGVLKCGRLAFESNCAAASSRFV